MTDVTDPQAALIAQQLSHTIDLLRHEINKLRTDLDHQEEFYTHRLSDLEECSKDHETRIRSIQEAATQFKVLAGLATGGGLMSLILLIRELAS